MSGGLPLPVRLSLVCALFLLLLSPYEACRADDEQMEPGQMNFRRHISNTQDEQIDPYTGVLRLKYLDFSLPGNGGLDLEIHRVYSSENAHRMSIEGMGDKATWWRYGPLGFGWDIHFGRMSRRNLLITVELGDGTKAKLVRQNNQGDLWMSTELWKLKYVVTDGVGQYTLYLPDGRQIAFGQFSNDQHDELMRWRYATSIRKNGEQINIEYGDADNKRKVTRVVDTLDRSVSFRYGDHNGIERLDSLVYDATGKTVATYHYPASPADSDVPQGRLASTLVRAETGIGDRFHEIWRYTYNRNIHDEYVTYNGFLAVARVQNPMGGVTHYQYDHVSRSCTNEDWGGEDVGQFSVTEKWLSGPGLGPYPLDNTVNPVWKYVYAPFTSKEGKINATGIKDPEGRNHLYLFASANTGGGAYKSGLIEKHLVRERDGNVSLMEEYVWRRLPAEQYNPDIEFPQNCMRVPGTWAIPVLAESRIYRGENVADYTSFGGSDGEDPWASWDVNTSDASLFAKSYDGYDGYGNPTAITEKGVYFRDDTAQWQIEKKTDASYWYVDDEHNYIVRDRPLAVTISGSDPDDHTAPFGGSYRINYAYYTDASSPASFGRTRAVDRFGIVTEYVLRCHKNPKKFSFSG